MNPLYIDYIDWRGVRTGVSGEFCLQSEAKLHTNTEAHFPCF